MLGLFLFANDIRNHPRRTRGSDGGKNDGRPKSLTVPKSGHDLPLSMSNILMTVETHALGKTFACMRARLNRLRVTVSAALKCDPLIEGFDANGFLKKTCSKSKGMQKAVQAFLRIPRNHTT
jgi:hypothetical protein